MLCKRVIDYAMLLCRSFAANLLHQVCHDKIISRKNYTYCMLSGLVASSELWGLSGSKPDSTEDTPRIGPVAREIIRSNQTSSRYCDAKFWRGGANSGVVLVF
ncbi:hypothetical protein AVEN_262241-1 [Araneus ventricosus]|uniref:Uncharacterized protein n=1 Tax=Araneus ventricosus TaxID=182803 RepID=A0A4Y2GIY9_ARAVE|nr:hypothetical protein AVEN_262241-1 [Araneus ventricosus]